MKLRTGFFILLCAAAVTAFAVPILFGGGGPFCIACSTPLPTPEALVEMERERPPFRPSDEELNRVMTERGLRWAIWCAPAEPVDSANPTYCGYAAPAEAMFRLYIENGAKPGWFKCEFPSQAHAKAWLYMAIKGEPNDFPKHKPPVSERDALCEFISGGAKPGPLPTPKAQDDQF